MKILLEIIRKFFTYLSVFYSNSLYIKIGLVRDIPYSAVISRKLGKCGRNFILRSGSRIIGDPSRLEVGDGVSFGRRTVIDLYPSYGKQNYNQKIIIGNNCKFGDDTHLTAIEGIKIGNGLLTGRRVLISDNSHGYYGLSLENISNVPPYDRLLYSKGKVNIGDNVWIGDGVAILSGVTIGNGVVIGANAVVTKDIPANSIVAGIPAKKIKSYD